VEDFDMRCGLILMTVMLAALVPVQPASAQKPPEGFTALFNGKDLTGWQVFGGKKEVWGAKDGLLFCEGAGGGWLMTDKEYGDHQLFLEFRLPKMGNSGVALRAPLKGNPAYEGMEIQLIDDLNWKGLQPWQQTGSVYDVIPAKKIATQPPGQWNSMLIILKGSKILIDVNNTKVVQDDLSKYLDTKGAKHPGLSRKTGHIGFQSYNFKVEFRNIWIKPIEEPK
jgi:hypothetical protein